MTDPSIAIEDPHQLINGYDIVFVSPLLLMVYVNLNGRLEYTGGCGVEMQLSSLDYKQYAMIAPVDLPWNERDTLPLCDVNKGEAWIVWADMEMVKRALITGNPEK